MNGDPYRTPQPADRRVINRSGQAAYQQRADEQPQLTNDESPKMVPRSSSAGRSSVPEKHSSKKGLWWTLGLIGLVLLLLAGWFVWSSSSKGADAGIDSSKYQAVFLTNGQIYFGDLHAYNDEYLRLTTGYYPQAKTTDAENSEKTTSPTANASGIQLIRLGDEVYGPENEIFISKKQILHYENLKPDSKVSQLIQQNEKSK